MTALALAAALAAGGAQARDWPSAGGWDLGEAETACGMMMDYEGEGETTLIVLLGVDGEVGLTLTNYNWSTEEGRVYEDFAYHLSDASYSGGKALGVKADYKKGVVTRFSGEFLKSLAASPYLHIYRGETLVDQLSLKGSSAALAVVRRCVATVAAERAAAQREKDRFSHIPKDPFANGE